MTLSMPQGAVADADHAVGWFDDTIAAVFAVLCRVTVGDLATSEHVLAATFAEAARRTSDPGASPLSRDELVSSAVAAYLRESGTVAPSAGARAGAPDAVDLGWSQARWAPTLEALRALDPRDRVALALVEVEGWSPAAVAELLGEGVDETTARCTAAREELTEALVLEPAPEAFSHAELWMDDALRDRVRRQITGTPHRRAATERARREHGPRSPVARARVTALAGGVVALALAVGGLRWLESAPNDERGQGAPIAAAPPSTTKPKPAVDPNDIVEPIPVLDLQLAGDLSDQAIVSLDQIVRYPEVQAVGLSWTGPCNRPAARVTFTQSANGIGVQLRTGAFSVVSCVGMPRRWTLVVEEYLGDGTILPVVDGHLDRTFHGASVDHNSDTQRLPGRLYGSALVDASNRPWVYPGRNCGAFGYIRRQSPDGAMFEVRTGLGADMATQPDETVGNVSCLATAIPRVLYGPNGSVFPQTDLSTGRRIPPDPAEPRDCHGPFGSATDVPSQRPYTTQFYDGDWSTWDGCLVRSDVIFSRYLSGACGSDAVRTITIADTLGERMGPVQRTHTYVRDPQRLLPRDIPPLLHYEHMPGKAIDSGLRHGTDQLWYTPKSPDAIYIVTATDVERWPLVTTLPTCGS